MTPRCRTCRKEIRFILMDSGKSMPVNPTPDPEGTIVARWDGARFAFGRVLRTSEGVPLGWKRFLPHWVDCEKASKTQKTPSTTRTALF